MNIDSAIGVEHDPNSLDPAHRPVRMGFFHFSNNNLSIRRQCAREVGMYDLNAVKSEDVELCFRIALSPQWVAWREVGVAVRHKGRRTLWELIRQMWGWGFYVGYPYAKTGIRGAYLYWLSGRTNKLAGRLETARLPILVCVFGTDFHLAQLAAVLALLLAFTGHWILAAVANGLMIRSARRYLSAVTGAGLRPLGTLKLAIVHYITDVAFTIATIVGGLRNRVVIIPSSIFGPAPDGSADD
jgi:hypothetical protein